MIDAADKKKKHILYLHKLAQTETAAFIRDYEGSFFIRCVSQIEDALYRRLRRIAEPSFDVIFLKEIEVRGLLEQYLVDETRISDELELISQELYCRLLDNGDQFISNTSEGLYAALRETVTLFFEMLSELLQRTESCMEKIAVTFFEGQRFDQICSLELDLGDMHNKGRSTTVIGTECGRVVYKLRSLKIDEATRIFFLRFFPDIVIMPRSLIAGDRYGFSEYIENDPVHGDAEARRYYERLGGLCAVICMLGVKDLHKGNLLSCDGYPVPIDLEMLLSPEKNEEITGIEHELAMSLYGSCLMPCRLGEGDVSFLFDESCMNVSAPVVDGKKRGMPYYKEALLQGFQTIYLRCISERKNIIRAMGMFYDTDIRYLVRSTRAYSILIKKTVSWGWINSPDRDIEVYKVLKLIFEKSGEKAFQSIVGDETGAILRGDVPYFHVEANGLSLLGEGGVVFEGFFSVSAVKRAEKKILQMNPSDMDFECALLSKAASQMSEEGSSSALRSFGDLTKKECIILAEELFRNIKEDRIVTPEGRMIWFCPDTKMEKIMSVMGGGFTSGFMGLAVFFAALSKISEKDAIREEAELMIQNLLSQLTEKIKSMEEMDVLYERQCGLGLENGFAGQLFALYIIDKLTEGSYCFELCSRMVRLARKLEVPYAKADVISGLAGFVKALCIDDRIFALPGASELCEQFSEKLLRSRDLQYKNTLLWETIAGKRLISGVGHGQAGIGSALYVAGMLLDRDDLIRAAEDAYSYEYDIYSKRLRGWPDLRPGARTDKTMCGYCSGAPGIGMSLLKSMSFWGGKEGRHGNSSSWDMPQSLIERAVDSCVSGELLPWDHLCCGNCATIDFLLEAGRRMERPELVRESFRRLKAISERAVANGDYSYITREGGRRFQPSLFYGAAGIGYELLRHAAPDVIDSPFL